MEAEQNHAHNTGTVSHSPNCTTTRADSDPQTTLCKQASSSATGGNGQLGPETTAPGGTSRSQPVQGGAAGGRHDWQAESVSKLFDKELDNHHEEKLLLAQVDIIMTAVVECHKPQDFRGSMALKCLFIKSSVACAQILRVCCSGLHDA